MCCSQHCAKLPEQLLEIWQHMSNYFSGIGSLNPSLVIEITVCDWYLHVVHTGRIDNMQLALDCFRSSLSEAENLRISRILADLTRVEYTPLSAIDRILYFQSAIEIYQATLATGSAAIKLAILQTPQAQSAYTPGIVTALEGGLDCRIFYGKESALAWLHDHALPEAQLSDSKANIFDSH